MAMLSTLIVVIILQCIHTSNHQIVPLRYISVLFVSYISIKGGGRKTTLAAVWKMDGYESKTGDKEVS